jgi:anti-sigma B factor antagonist
MSGPEFSVSLQDEGPWVVVSVLGDVDLSTSPTLREALANAVGRRLNVVVDLSRATFLDSTGLGDLVRGREEALEIGRQFHLVVTNPRIQRVLQITGLDEVFFIHDSLAAATT